MFKFHLGFFGGVVFESHVDASEFVALGFVKEKISEACDANAAQAAAGARAAALQRSGQQTMTMSPQSWRREWSEDARVWSKVLNDSTDFDRLYIIIILRWN